jgi:hypothetical protein
MMKTKNPAARASANRVLNVKLFSDSIDSQNPSEFPHTTQSELLAVSSVMRRFRVSFWHAKTICQLNGLGGQHA